jgi:hypothetical protein
MYEYILGGLTASLAGLISTYVMGKYMLSDDKILERLDTLSTRILADTEFQKKIYMMGALIGNGISQGVGLQKKGGKFGIESIIAQVLPGFINKFLPQGQQQNTGVGDFGQGNSQ